MPDRNHHACSTARHPRSRSKACQGCVGKLPDDLPRDLRSFSGAALHRDSRKDFDKAIEFIRTCELRVPATPALPDDKILVSSDFIERMRVFVYYWRYLFRDDLERVHALMESLQSPLAPHFWEAVHSLNLQLVECDLEKLGYPVKELKCYKYWLSQQPA